jgi:glycerophosphoryl diester phosphodiesterase
MTDHEQPARVAKTFRIIAHRGASGYAPENTPSAFEAAACMGATEIEYDLQFSKDRQLVVVHDMVLDRYGYPGVRVADLTLAELKALDMGAWFDPRFAGEKIATFDEILERFGAVFTHHAEIKAPAPGLAARLLETLDARGAAARTIVTSFAFDSLVEVRRLSPEIRVGWLVAAGEFNGENVRRAAQAGFYQFCPSACDTDRKNVAAAKALVAEVRAHGVRTRADLRQAVAAGCDGVTINWPDWVLHE